MKKTDYRFAFLYLIGSFSVVVGHSGESVNLFFDWFAPYSFHLPLFLFCSGYFYKHTSTEHVFKYTLKKLRTLIIPLYLYNLLYGIFVLFTRMFGFTIGNQFNYHNLLIEPLLGGHQFRYNLGTWFVAPFFCVQIVNLFFRQLLKMLRIKENDWVIFIIYISISVIGVYILNAQHAGKSWLLFSHTLYMLPFYEFGVLYKNEIENWDRLPNGIYFFLVFFIQLITISAIGGVSEYNIQLFEIGIRQHFVVSYLQTLMAILFWLRVSKILLPIIQGNRFIKISSDSAFSIMANQFLGFMLVKTIFAVVSKYTTYCTDFNFEKYRSDIYYYYLPHNDVHWCILYSVFGMVIPIIIHIGITNISCRIKSMCRDNRLCQLG